MPGGKVVNVGPWHGWLRHNQLDWLRRNRQPGRTASDMVRDAIDLFASVVDGNEERTADVLGYIRMRYEK